LKSGVHQTCQTSRPAAYGRLRYRSVSLRSKAQNSPKTGCLKIGQVVPDFAHVQFRGNDNGRRYCMLSAVSAAPGPQGHAFPPIRRLQPLLESPECKGRTSGCRNYGDDPPMEPLLIWIRAVACLRPPHEIYAYQSLELEVRSSNGHSMRQQWRGSIRSVRRWIYTSR